MDIEMGDVTFLTKIEKLLVEGKTDQALTLFKDEKNNEEICNNSWELIPIISRYLDEATEDRKIEVYKCCQKLIDIIAEVAKPEEALLQLIEEIETAKDDTKFLALLRPSEKVLLKVPDKRITSLAWCFNAIKTYLVKLETPDNFNLTDEERLLLDSNPLVNRIIDVYDEVLIFCDTFLHELSSTKSRYLPERKGVLCKFLVELVGKPLALLDMEMYKKTKPKVRIIAEKLIDESTSIIRDPCMFLEMQEDDDYSDLVKPSDLALGVFYYLILSQGVCLKTIPKVYNPVYILHHSLQLVTELLIQDGEFAVEKGIQLATTVLKSINKLQLSYHLLDSECHSKFCKTISNVIVHNDSEKVRRSALKILHDYIWSFEHQGRYLIIINLIRTLGHSGLKGNLISQYKEMLTQELRENNWEKVSRYYKGRKLFDLLNEFTYLKNKETDMVDESDQIVSTLNLLRYIIIADKTGCTEIDSYRPILEENYFKNLKTGIEMSKEHYRFKVKEINKEKRAPKGQKSDCEVSVTVSGKNLVEMPTEKKIEILNMSLTTLDVIDSLLSRVTECLRARKNPV